MESWKRVITRDLGVELEGLELGKDTELGEREKAKLFLFLAWRIGRKDCQAWRLRTEEQGQIEETAWGFFIQEMFNRQIHISLPELRNMPAELFDIYFSKSSSDSKSLQGRLLGVHSDATWALPQPCGPPLLLLPWL